MESKGDVLEQLDSALAHLAETLGITVGELWGWLSDTGLSAYARATTVNHVASAIAALMFMVASVVGARWALKETDEYEPDMYDALIVVFIATAIIAAIVATANAISAAGWIISPEDMVLREIVQAVNG